MSPSRKIKKSLKKNIFIIFIVGFFTGTNLTSTLLTTGEDIIHLSIVYGSEKASWMTIAYSNFMDWWENKHPNQKIAIDMHPYGSSDSIISILNGEIFPTIWSPASSIWMPILNTKWLELTHSNEPIVNINESIRIIYSPIVIATWESFYKQHSFKGFKDLHELNLDQNVNVKMAHTDPRLSNSGFMATIMAISAASGVLCKDLSMIDLTNPQNQQWLKEFESSAVLYGKSTGFLGKYMKSEGPDTLNVAFLYENLIFDISNDNTEDKVIAVYPEEGTLYSDHPFCILNADWITPEQREVAEAFLEFLQKRETVNSALQFGFRPIDTTIPLDPNVFNYEKNGLSYEISVPEMKAPVDGNVILKIPDLWLLCKATA